MKETVDIIHDFLIKRIVSCCANSGRSFNFFGKRRQLESSVCDHDVAKRTLTQGLLDVMWHWHHHRLLTHSLHSRSTNHDHTCMLKPSRLHIFNWEFQFWILTSWKTNLFWTDWFWSLFHYMTALWGNKLMMASCTFEGLGTSKSWL